MNEKVETVEDNPYGIILRVSNGNPVSVTTHLATVMIFRDKEGKINYIDIEFEDTEGK